MSFTPLQLSSSACGSVAVGSRLPLRRERRARESSSARRSPRPASSCCASRFDVDVDAESDLAAIIGRYDAIVIRSATKLTADLIAAADEPQGDRPRGRRRRQRRRRGGDAPRDRRRERARVEHRLGRRAHGRPARRARAQHPAGARARSIEGRWERSKWGGVELAEKTLGVLGFGRIGQQVARRALGLQMRVVAYDPFVSADRFRELGVESDTLDGVLARADFVTLHLPLNDETRGVIDAEALAEDEGRRADRQRRPRRARRRGGAARGARVGQDRRRRDRRLRAGAVLGPAARRAEPRRRRRTSPPRPTRRRTAPA